MHELVNTRHNPMIDPAMHIWGWEIPVYLFLGGLRDGDEGVFKYDYLRLFHFFRQNKKYKMFLFPHTYGCSRSNITWNGCSIP